MSGYRLTKYDRKCIAVNATNDNFESKIIEARKELADLHQEIYNSVFGEDLLKKIREIPIEWLNKSSYMKIRLYNGYQMDINFPESIPLPQNATKYYYEETKLRPLLKDKDLGDRLMALDDHIKDLVKERDDASYKLMSLLNSVSTLKQLKEIWPDGDLYYSHLTPTKRSYVNNVPAILIEDINKIFCLPKEDLAA